MVLARLGVDVAFKGGRRRAQDAHRARELRPHDRDIAAVIARSLVLLVRGFMLLVDDDQAQIPDGREDGRAGADDYPRLAGRERQPAVEALAFAEVAVPHHAAMPRSDFLQPGAQAGDGLGRQRHLRHQHRDAPALLEGRV